MLSSFSRKSRLIVAASSLTGEGGGGVCFEGPLVEGVEGAAFEPPGAGRFGRLGDGDHLGMCRGIAKLLALVPCFGNDAIALKHERADRHLPFFGRLLSQSEGSTHPDLMHHSVAGSVNQ